VYSSMSTERIIGKRGPWGITSWTLWDEQDLGHSNGALSLAKNGGRCAQDGVQMLHLP